MDFLEEPEEWLDLLAGNLGHKEKNDSAYTKDQTQAEHENVLGALKEIEALPLEISGTVHRNSPDPWAIIGKGAFESSFRDP